MRSLTRLAGALALLAAVVTVTAACTRTPAAAPTPPAPVAAAPTAAAAASSAVVGSWSALDTSGKAASLSELTLAQDGTFTYGGRNAHGVPVTFSGRYDMGTEQRGPWIRLTYSDFPDRPTVWFYRLAPDTLTVSAVRGDLSNGTALVFTRR